MFALRKYGVFYFTEGFMTRLILIRHGQTDYNLEKRYCGFSDPPLNDKGMEEVKTLAVRLRGLRINKVYSSNLRRAYGTARLIFKSEPIEKSSDFREMNFGIFEGLNYKEIVKKYPKLYRDWIKNPIEVNIPKGERLKELSKRVRKKISSILSQYKGKAIAVVTHSGPIRVILCDALRYDLEAFWQIEQDHCALSIIDYEQRSSPVVVMQNAISCFLKEGALTP